MPVPVLLPVLGLFDMLPLDEPPDVLLLPLVDDPLLPELVLLGELEEPAELPPAALLEPCAALNSSRLSLPSWSLSSWSNDLPLLDDELPPEAALFCDDEPEEDAPEDDGLLLLLCDIDGDFDELLDCFDVSFA